MLGSGRGSSRGSSRGSPKVMPFIDSNELEVNNRNNRNSNSSSSPRSINDSSNYMYSPSSTRPLNDDNLMSDDFDQPSMDSLFKSLISSKVREVEERFEHSLRDFNNSWVQEKKELISSIKAVSSPNHDEPNDGYLQDYYSDNERDDRRQHRKHDHDEATDRINQLDQLITQLKNDNTRRRPMSHDNDNKKLQRNIKRQLKLNQLVYRSKTVRAKTAPNTSLLGNNILQNAVSPFFDEIRRTNTRSPRLDHTAAYEREKADSRQYLSKRYVESQLLSLKRLIASVRKDGSKQIKDLKKSEAQRAERLNELEALVQKAGSGFSKPAANSYKQNELNENYKALVAKVSNFETSTTSFSNSIRLMTEKTDRITGDVSKVKEFAQSKVDEASKSSKEDIKSSQSFLETIISEKLVALESKLMKTITSETRETGNSIVKIQNEISDLSRKSTSSSKSDASAVDKNTLESLGPLVNDMVKNQMVAKISQLDEALPKLIETEVKEAFSSILPSLLEAEVEKKMKQFEQKTSSIMDKDKKQVTDLIAKVEKTTTESDKEHRQWRELADKVSKLESADATTNKLVSNQLKETTTLLEAKVEKALSAFESKLNTFVQDFTSQLQSVAASVSKNAKDVADVKRSMEQISKKEALVSNDRQPAVATKDIAPTASSTESSSRSTSAKKNTIVFNDKVEVIRPSVIASDVKADSTSSKKSPDKIEVIRPSVIASDVKADSSTTQDDESKPNVNDVIKKSKELGKKRISMKQNIRKWIEDFEKENGRKPTDSEKIAISPMWEELRQISNEKDEVDAIIANTQKDGSNSSRNSVKMSSDSSLTKTDSQSSDLDASSERSSKKRTKSSKSLRHAVNQVTSLPFSP